MKRMKPHTSTTMMGLSLLYAKKDTTPHVPTHKMVMPIAYHKCPFLPWQGRAHVMARAKLQDRSHVMVRTTPYPSANMIAAPKTFFRTAPKPGVPTSVVTILPAHALAIPKPCAHIRMSVYIAAWQQCRSCVRLQRQTLPLSSVFQQTQGWRRLGLPHLPVYLPHLVACLHWLTYVDCK
jgi:hypothetical protein